MSAEREELARLVQQIPDDQVARVLTEVRSHLRPRGDGGASRPWPPAFFGIAAGDGTRSHE